MWHENDSGKFYWKTFEDISLKLVKFDKVSDNNAKSALKIIVPQPSPNKVWLPKIHPVPWRKWHGRSPSRHAIRRTVSSGSDRCISDSVETKCGIPGDSGFSQNSQPNQEKDYMLLVHLCCFIFVAYTFIHIRHIWPSQMPPKGSTSVLPPSVVPPSSPWLPHGSGVEMIPIRLGENQTIMRTESVDFWWKILLETHRCWNTWCKATVPILAPLKTLRTQLLQWSSEWLSLECPANEMRMRPFTPIKTSWPWMTHPQTFEETSAMSQNWGSNKNTWKWLVLRAGICFFRRKFWDTPASIFSMPSLEPENGRNVRSNGLQYISIKFSIQSLTSITSLHVIRNQWLSL